MSISGNLVGAYSQTGKTFIIVDEEGNEYTGIVVGKEIVFTATVDDIVEGKTAGTEDGVVVGTHRC